MRLSISQKLMLALLGLTLVVLIATLGLARWSFERGFLDYVNALEQTRLTNLSEGVVGPLYIANGNKWEGIDSRRLEQRINQIPRGIPPPPHLNRGRHKPPPPLIHLSAPRRPPPPHEAMAQHPPRHVLSGKPPRQGLHPTILLDAQRNKIIGQLDALFEESIDVPVIVDGQMVGMLKSEPKRFFDSSIETAFSRQQWITSGVIGIASLLLAALVSWGLVGLLLSPVRNMISSVSRLTKGDYSQQSSGNRQDEFGQLMGDINYLTQTLEKNQTARRRWIADISHELRTPLAVLTGEIEALKDGIRPFNKAQLHSLDEEIQRLRHLTDDLYELSVSDVGGLRYEFSEIDLVGMVTQFIKSHALIAKEQGVELSLAGETSALVSADSKRINQLLSNLVSNSLAYTDAPGRMLFNIKIERTDVVLTVSDTAPGVTPAECSQLFEPLYRQDTSRTRRDSGAGLGLAICRNIVEAHRGTIVASPSSLGGLQIVIKLPLLQQEAG